MNPLQGLAALDQSIWLDFIRRNMLASGELTRMVEQDAISGITSNPAIFEKAIGGSNDYDDAIRELAAEGKDIRSLIGYMPENDSFVAGMTAVHFVRLMAELSGIPPEPALERAHETLFYVGLGEARYRKLGTFSTGMKQMVKLAQALVHGPRLLMLDEPTNGLDPPARKRMLDLVTDIRNRGETSILLSSHLLRDVESVCDEVLILRDGRIAASCDLEAERRANRSFVEVELQTPHDAFAEELMALGCELAVHDGGRFKLVLPDACSVRELYVLADRLGVGIRRLDLKRDSLQDIFLRAMEGNNGGI